MIPQLLTLFCVGLCVGQEDTGRDESLPKPSLRAWPSPVVPAQSNMTLRCRTPTKDVNFVLRKGRDVLESLKPPHSTEGLAEFHLTHLNSRHAGEYSCEYYRKGHPRTASQPSDVLLLLVTGYLQKPSLQAHQRGVVAEGEDVTLQCQRPDTASGTMFALLKAGASMSVQLQSSEEKKVDFSLRNVTVNNTGNYSCVYYQTESPFQASHPSDPLAIWVTGKNGGKSSKRAKTRSVTTGIILTAVFTLLSFLACFLIYRYSRCRPDPDKRTKSFCSSKDPEEVVMSSQPGEESGEVPAAVKSGSPALDEGSQVSTAEEPQTDLNTRALREGPSSQMQEPVEPYEHSIIKT